LCHQLSEPRLLVRAVTRIDVFDERGVDVGDRDVRAVLGEHTSERKAHAAAPTTVILIWVFLALLCNSSLVLLRRYARAAWCPPPQPIRRGELCRAAKDTANEAAVAND